MSDQYITGNPERVEMDRISFKGHQNILGLHKNTIEITRDKDISIRADCIIGVEASKACAALNQDAKDWIRSGRWLEFEIRLEEKHFLFTGKGNANLDLSDAEELVLRRSSFLSGRTVAICCSHAALDVPREIITRLQDPSTFGELIIRALPNKKDDTELHWNLP